MSWRLPLALFLVFQGLFGLTASGRVDRVPDEFEVYLQAESLIDRGRLSIPQCPPQTFYGMQGVDGLPYAPFGPASAFLVAPHHLAGRALAFVCGVPRSDVAAWSELVAGVRSLLERHS